jgi:glutathione synthase/RimK-type ligase-like ATP-grasp enzyme
VTLIWFNQGYSSVRDALVMIREEAGNDVRLLASHRDMHAPAMHVADQILVEPSVGRSTPGGESAYLDFCLETCAARGVGLFVAQSGRASLAEHQSAFAAIGTKLLVPTDGETLKLIDDKARFYKVACAASIPMPWTREITDVAGYDAALAELEALGIAACVKPPQGVFGGGFWKLKPNRRMFETLMNPDGHEIAPVVMRDAITEAQRKRLLVMEYLAGPEWSIDCVCKDGELIVGVGRRKLGRVQRLEVNGPIFEIARKAIRTFGLSGLINVQCKAADAEGNDVRLLEINSRMSGGCLYTRYSGVKLPWVQVALELGLMARADVPVPVGGALVAPSAEAYQIIEPQVPLIAERVNYA